MYLISQAVDFSRCCSRVSPNARRLGVGRGFTKAATDGELPNYHYSVREQTPRLTPNRLLCVRCLSVLFIFRVIFRIKFFLAFFTAKTFWIICFSGFGTINIIFSTTTFTGYFCPKKTIMTINFIRRNYYGVFMIYTSFSTIWIDTKSKRYIFIYAIFIPTFS